MVSPEKKETFDAIVDIITATLHIDKEAVKLNSTLQDLGADSLSMVEIILKIEDRFGVEIDDAKAEQLTNVQEVVDYISSLRNQ